MRLGRLAPVVAALATTLVFALLLRDAVQAARSPSSIPQAAPVCSTPGQDTVFASFDRMVTVRVPGSSPRTMRVEFYSVVDAHEAPSPPGAFV